ncbi:hypothetical protein Poli38472_012881 [Pythium oligandrum]|uniref:phosphoribosylaminoimidazole carboxylase n=1 Tax=Pythium oligandrum TaxID=41045 RepID=A0A8K1FKJ4_PYTOL|nr:hypothetical protein Poli38472_012881 [Pythium oligandrum]|eukprot:TMW64259.1 hypothetical protein Poli38472_012881 [Pythium oligandrum]
MLRHASARRCSPFTRHASLSTTTTSSSLLTLLQRVAEGQIAPQDAVRECQQLEYDALGEFAKIDTNRLQRTGFPEVIYAEGKTPEQVAKILVAMSAKGEENVMATRVAADAVEHVRAFLPETHRSRYHYYESARILASKDVTKARADEDKRGSCCVLAAGTSDLPVAEEAVVTLELGGYRVTRLYDVGVAGIHRLLKNQHVLHQSDVAICVAGMDGALPGVVGGLTSNPVIAVPTSIGYGAAFGGLAPLLTMLNACSPGVGVVNIDNGFGAAVLAARILTKMAPHSH